MQSKYSHINVFTMGVVSKALVRRFFPKLFLSCDLQSTCETVSKVPCSKTTKSQQRTFQLLEASLCCGILIVETKVRRYRWKKRGPKSHCKINEAWISWALFAKTSLQNIENASVMWGFWNAKVLSNLSEIWVAWLILVIVGQFENFANAFESDFHPSLFLCNGFEENICKSDIRSARLYWTLKYLADQKVSFNLMLILFHVQMSLVYGDWPFIKRIMLQKLVTNLENIVVRAQGWKIWNAFFAMSTWGRWIARYSYPDLTNGFGRCVTVLYEG